MDLGCNHRFRMVNILKQFPHILIIIAIHSKLINYSIELNSDGLVFINTIRAHV